MLRISVFPDVQLHDDEPFVLPLVPGEPPLLPLFPCRDEPGATSLFANFPRLRCPSLDFERLVWEREYGVGPANADFLSWPIRIKCNECFSCGSGREEFKICDRCFQVLEVRERGNIFLSRCEGCRVIMPFASSSPRWCAWCTPNSSHCDGQSFSRIKVPFFGSFAYEERGGIADYPKDLETGEGPCQGEGSVSLFEPRAIGEEDC